jgi:NDP-sugar pyrophosphorylase family protein
MPHAITKAVILAGGKGSRLHPVTLEIPKPLITIRKTPLINYNLSLLAAHGVRDAKVIIRPGDRPDYERWLREYRSTFPGMAIELVEEPEPMGTLGFVFHHLSDWVGDGNIFVTNGDDIKDVDLAEMAAFHERMNLPVTVALVTEKERNDGGFVLVRENKIANFFEKDPTADTKLISAGMYILSAHVFENIVGAGLHKKKHLMFETDLFPVLAKAGKLGGFIYDGKLFDCGTFERWEQAIREV